MLFDKHGAHMCGVQYCLMLLNSVERWDLFEWYDFAQTFTVGVVIICSHMFKFVKEKIT